ncbi:nucleoid-associated protein (plasmid) [Clostridium beijerinckii]|uniref:nucleoid-associated protein n=1 Tax=Clostridium beijerinckii TaxID=1520 RepID=UPI00222721D6|nr:nucleoid-associated protein [Clostridium beijerinckii]UYZ39062.1 nucleoid-associated protein [Clostridium beijerinckii]
MEYIKEVNIKEAIIHVLDTNASEPILNEYSLDLDEETYNFIYKHITRCIKSEELKYARFNAEENRVKEIVQDYYRGNDKNLIYVSKELAKQLFVIMKNNSNISSGDIIIASIITDQGPMIALLKLDYVKSFTHEVKFKDKKIGVGLIHHLAGLPESGRKIQKAAFIKPYKNNENVNLMVLDKKKKGKDDSYGTTYFIESYLNADIITNERDMTKRFVKSVENWTRKNMVDDAAKAEGIRTKIKYKLKENDKLDIYDVSEELFHGQPKIKEDFINYISQQGIDDVVQIDKIWVDKKLKKIKLNIDNEIDLYISKNIYQDISKFEIQKNDDGTINLLVKNISNYIEK